MPTGTYEIYQVYYTHMSSATSTWTCANISITLGTEVPTGAHANLLVALVI